MIKDIIGVINEDIYVTRYTNKTVYLSNGNHWNHYKFRQAEMWLNQFIKIESSKNKEVHIVLKKIEKLKEQILSRHKKRLDMYKAVVDELQQELDSIDLVDILIKSNKKVIIPFGKYEGQDLITIAKEDKTYLEFLVKHKFISIENIVMK